MKKILLTIIDGLSDKSIPQLRGKTPLETAKTPNLDWLAKNGICGLIKPFKFPKEKVPSSEGTHIALLGFIDYFLGRGVYEVAGIGMKLRKGEVALRGNFATVSRSLKVIDRRAGRISETKLLVKALQGIKIDGVKFLIKKSYGHRAGLVLRGKNLSSKISDGDPHKAGVRVKKILPLDKSKEAAFTADILNKFLKKTYRILNRHPFNKERIKKGLLPGNYLLIRGAGELKDIPAFRERFGFKACCIAGGALYKGIAKILGMNLIKVRGANGFANTDLKGKILAAKKNLKKYDFIFLHIKAADSLAEDGNFLGKKEFIEKIDKNLKPILNLKDTLIVVTADHSTCSLLKRHCSELIPILVYPPKFCQAKLRWVYGNGKNGVKKFSEKNCKKERLGIFEQLDLMPKILKLRTS